MDIQSSTTIFGRFNKHRLKTRRHLLLEKTVSIQPMTSLPIRIMQFDCTRYPEDGGFDYFDAAGGIEGMPQIDGTDPVLLSELLPEDSFATPLAARPDGVFILILVHFE
jgi:hypothetical protein